jgi:hypothetical protein
MKVRLIFFVQPMMRVGPRYDDSARRGGRVFGLASREGLILSEISSRQTKSKAELSSFRQYSAALARRAGSWD